MQTEWSSSAWHLFVWRLTTSAAMSLLCSEAGPVARELENAWTLLCRSRTLNASSSLCPLALLEALAAAKIRRLRPSCLCWRIILNHWCSIRRGRRIGRRRRRLFSFLSRERSRCRKRLRIQQNDRKGDINSVNLDSGALTRTAPCRSITFEGAAALKALWSTIHRFVKKDLKALSEIL